MTITRRHALMLVGCTALAPQGLVPRYGFTVEQVAALFEVPLHLVGPADMDIPFWFSELIAWPERDWRVVPLAELLLPPAEEER